MSKNFRNNKQLQNIRAAYWGAKRRNDSLENQKADLTTAIHTGKIFVEHPQEKGQTVAKCLTAAQITDCKRKLELVNNDLFSAAYNLKEKEFTFTNVVKGNTAILRGKRMGLREDLDLKKAKNISKMINANSEIVKEDIVSFKNTYPENQEIQFQAMKGALLKIIRKVNTGLPLTNISKKLFETLYKGISKWDGINLQIMEVL